MAIREFLGTLKFKLHLIKQCKVKMVLHMLQIKLLGMHSDLVGQV